MASGTGTRRGSRPISMPSLRALSIQGYKAIAEEQTIELRPLTLLAGANSAGKSSMFQPLLLLKQTLSTPFDPGPLLLDGPNVRLTSSDQLMAKGSGDVKSRFNIGLHLDNARSLKISFESIPKQGMKIQEMEFNLGEASLLKATIKPGMSSEEIEKSIPDLKEFRKRVIPKDGSADWAIVRDRCFLELELRNNSGLRFPSTVTRQYQFGNQIENIIHVPGLRGNPGRTYSVAAVGNTFPGTFEAYVASVVNHWRLTNDENLKGLGKDLEAVGLTWKVEARPKDDTQVELLVGRLPHATQGGAKDLVSIADVGFGVSQILPVLVALRVAQPGQLVYLEQPEIHLHPRAQRRMASLLAKAAMRGVKVVVETHSSLLLRAIQTIVAKGKELDHSKVKLHWFARDPSTGNTKVTSADLDQDGSYGLEWPEDFDDVALESEQAYLDAVEAREATK